MDYNKYKNAVFSSFIRFFAGFKFHGFKKADEIIEVIIQVAQEIFCLGGCHCTGGCSPDLAELLSHAE